MPEAGGLDVPFPAAVPEDPDWLPPEMNTGTTHPARVCGYWLGGKDHFAADREARDSIIKAMPSTVSMARVNRVFPVLAWRPDGEPARRSPRRLQLRRSRAQVVRP